nr:MAG TPA: hypothetical protein [Caudoviricetes sp.]
MSAAMLKIPCRISRIITTPNICRFLFRDV